MQWPDALKGINQILTDVVIHGKGKLEIYITPRGETITSVSVLAGKRMDFEVEKKTITIIKYEED